MSEILLVAGHLGALGAALAVLAWMARAGRGQRELYGAALAMATVLALVAFKCSEPDYRFADFEMAYWRAGKAVMNGPDALAAVLGPEAHGFVNLPILAYLLVPFALLPAKLAGLVWLALGIVCLGMAWRLLKNWGALDARASAQLMVLLAAAGPTIYGLKEGNSSHMLLLAALAGIAAAQAGRKFKGGALMGLAALIKPPLMILGVYYVLRRDWRVVAGGAAVLAGCGAVSVLVMGWDVHVAWYESSIARYSRLTLGTFNVQSVASFFARLVRGVPGLDNWAPFALPQGYKLASQALSLVLVGSGFAACVFARLAGPPSDAQDERVELSMALIIAAAASPLSWSHYFIWLYPAIALLLRAGVGDGRGARMAFWVALAMFAPLVVLIKPASEPLASAVLLGTSGFLYAAFTAMALLVLRRLKPAWSQPQNRFTRP